MAQNQKQKVKELIKNSMFVEPDERKFWLGKVDSLNDEFLSNLEKIFISEKDEFKKFLVMIKKYDPEGKILKEFNRTVKKGLKNMRETVEQKEKKFAEKDLEKALKKI